MARALCVDDPKVSEVLGFWEEFGLDQQRSQLDAKGLQIAENKQRSSKARKALTDDVKAFRALDKTEKPSHTIPLMKKFMKEVDLLTKRSTFGEMCFLKLYKSIYGMQDPAPLLREAILQAQSNAKGGARAEQLQAKLQQYEKEFANLTNQDTTIRRLEQQLQQFESKLEEQVQENVAAVEADLQAQVDEQTRLCKQREAKMAAKVEAAETKVSAMQKALALKESELTKLRKQLSGYKAEMSSLTNQDTTIRRLEAKMARLQNDTEAQVKKGVKEIENKLQIELDQEKKRLSSREQEFAKRVEQAKQAQRVAEERADELDSKLFRLQGQHEEEKVGRDAELELLIDEMARNKARMELLERENEKIKEENRELLESSSKAGDALVDDSLQLQVIELQESLQTKENIIDDYEIAQQKQRQQLKNIQQEKEQLGAEVARLRTCVESAVQAEVDKIQTEHDKVTSELRSQLSTAQAALEEARSVNLSRQNDKSTSSQNTEKDGDGDGDDEGDGKAHKGTADSEGSEVGGSNEHSKGVEAQSEDLRRENESQRQTIEEQKTLIHRLEEDLASALQFRKKSDGGDVLVMDPQQSAIILSEIVGDLDTEDPSASPSPSPSAPSTPEPHTNTPAVVDAAKSSPRVLGEKSMLRMITEQRDRYRSRVQSSAEAIHKIQLSLDEALARNTTLQEDNISLFEKIKFLQSYAGTTGEATPYPAPAVGASNPTAPSNEKASKSGFSQSDTRSQTTSKVTSKYAKLYESRVERLHNPFRQFRAAEAQRSFQKMNIAEKITLSSSRFLLSNKTLRQALFFYALILHLLVFYTLNQATHHVEMCLHQNNH